MSTEDRSQPGPVVTASPAAGTQTLEAMTRTYQSGPMLKSWGARQESGLSQQEKALLENHGRDRGLRVCNVGCGSGRECFAMFRMGFRDVIGVDCAPNMVGQAQQYAQQHDLGIRFEVGRADQLPFPDQTFGLLTMFENVYGHITPRAARLTSLQEIRRVLKVGGVALMTVSSRHELWASSCYFRVVQVVRRFWNPAKMEPGDKNLARALWGVLEKGQLPPRSHWFDPAEVPQDAQSVGLTVRQATTVQAIVQGRPDDTGNLRGQGRLLYALVRT